LLKELNKQIINAYDDASNKICLSCTDFKIGADYYQITYNKEIGKLSKKKQRNFLPITTTYSGHWRRTWAGDPCIYPGKALRSVCSTGSAKAKVEH
jgi:hypothetical protein